jgi:aspartyl aminopeptidase
MQAASRRIGRGLALGIVVFGVVASAALQGQQARPSGSAWDTKRSAWETLAPGERDQVFGFAEQYKAYLSAARSALDSTREVVKMARAAGFADFTSPSQVRPGARLIVDNRGRAVILAVVGAEPAVDGLRLVAAHHDTPHIDLKSRPIHAAGGFTLFKTIYYGGIKKYQWANRPLALVGRVDTEDGRRVDVSIGLKAGEPVFVIPDNAPHSDQPLRGRTYEQVFAGEELDPVAGSIPGADAAVGSAVVEALRSAYGIAEEDLASAELQLVPAENPADVGLDRGLVGGYGQDDRLSCYCAVRAVTAMAGVPRRTAMVYLSNFEEVGSVNNTGAASRFLESTIARLVAAERGGAYTELDLRQALRHAEVVSADTNDGINPVFPQTSEPSGAARLGFGATIKKYGPGFDANSEFIAKVRALLDRHHVAWQTQTPKVDGYSGGTIGGFLSAQEMEVIDMGVPLLSMHAPYEMSSKVDLWSFYRFMAAFLAS